MKYHVLSGILTISIIGTVCSDAFAQAASAPSDTLGALAVEAVSLNGRRMKLSEDIEIMRKLLDSTVRDFYANTSKNSHLLISKGQPAMSGMQQEMQGGFGMMGVSSSSRKTNSLSEPIGTYIDGYGVIYQWELPPVKDAPKKTVKKTLADCPFMSLSRWERTRRHLIGELKTMNCLSCHNNTLWKSADEYFDTVKKGSDRASYSGMIRNFTLTASSNSVEFTREELINRLVHLLAENGYHVRTNLTLAISFRKPKSPRHDGVTMMGTMGGAGMGEMMGMEAYGGGSGFEGSYGSMGASGGGDESYVAGSSSRRSKSRKPPQNGIGASGTTTSASGDFGGSSGLGGAPGAAFGGEGLGGSAAGGFGSASGGFGYGGRSGGGNAELSGDLHMRQGNFQKAMEEYEKSLKKFPKGVNSQTRRLIQKLARTNIAAGNLEKGKQLLDSLIKHAEKSKTVRENAKPNKISLPARLVISVTKENLEAVTSGKISREQFRNKVTIDYFDPNSAATTQKDENKKTPSAGKSGR